MFEKSWHVLINKNHAMGTSNSQGTPNEKKKEKKKIDFPGIREAHY